MSLFIARARGSNRGLTVIEQHDLLPVRDQKKGEYLVAEAQ